MRRTAKTSIFPLLILGAFLMFGSSCTEDDNEPSHPYNGKSKAIFNPDVTYSKMTDQDGNEYKTVTIGSQTWMAENLRTTKYNDGTAIPNVTDSAQWGALKTGAYCNYNNTASADTIATYGRLYNWHTVNTGKLAPVGWHVPSVAEWTDLVVYCGGDNATGGKIKEVGTIHWITPNTGATNESGFTAIPLGGRGVHGAFDGIGYSTGMWSSTEYFAKYAWRLGVSRLYSFVTWGPNGKAVGYSVRCVKD